MALHQKPNFFLNLQLMAVARGVYPIKPEDTDILLANGIVLTKFTAFSPIKTGQLPCCERISSSPDLLLYQKMAEFYNMIH